MTKVPGASSFLTGKVDETIEKEVKENLEQTLPEKLADELAKGLRLSSVIFAAPLWWPGKCQKL